MLKKASIIAALCLTAICGLSDSVFAEEVPYTVNIVSNELSMSVTPTNTTMSVIKTGGYANDTVVVKSTDTKSGVMKARVTNITPGLTLNTGTGSLSANQFRVMIDDPNTTSKNYDITLKDDADTPTKTGGTTSAGREYTYNLQFQFGSIAMGVYNFTIKWTLDANYN